MCEFIGLDRPERSTQPPAQAAIPGSKLAMRNATKGIREKKSLIPSQLEGWM